MNLENVEMFLMIARLGSINKAAEALFLAQSTVTHRLKQLERQLQTTLFVRTANGVSLTLEGKRFVPVATSIVEQMRQFTQESRPQQPLTIVSGKAFASFELPRLLGAYRLQHPQFTCYVKAHMYEESITALLTGQADLALLGHEIYHPQLVQVPLPSDRVVLIVSPQHEWGREFPGFDGWGLQEVIAFGDPNAPFRQRVDRYLAEHGVYANVIMELDSFSAVKKMVMQNLGVALLPERTVREELVAGRLVSYDISVGELSRPTLIAYPKHKEGDAEFLAFVEWIQQEY
ncbi:MAG TPA: LysR family transcriptional regulator [Bacilli bacterium]|nr:LysR family transcriptional regulator [Bacilli bacterium]